MNNNYNYSDFDGIRLTANNELAQNGTRQKSEQLRTHSYETPSEKQIEEMLLRHSKFYVYCE